VDRAARVIAAAGRPEEDRPAFVDLEARAAVRVVSDVES
jgi:hypothetical protein